MQKIRLLAQLISTLVSHQVGDIIEVSDSDAQRLVTAGATDPRWFFCYDMTRTATGDSLSRPCHRGRGA